MSDLPIVHKSDIPVVRQGDLPLFYEKWPLLTSLEIALRLVHESNLPLVHDIL